MNLQNRTLQRYRQFFPQETLREISGKTGIQITRVFRLFNGKTMKVGELEAFEKIIAAKIAESPCYSRLNSSLEEASALLTNEELGKLADYVERKLVVKRFGRTYIRSVSQNAIIA